ncbi:uncharacterized protein LOC131254291 [Magnolia sinica]|uniref:uncharacterized protein LOC131254291 n=1 Tax=Magnolia sinica TaxID=86752 RepID=UPI0026582739|nr:uncharacterized protein LOC131254291 [Magnolia sinica]
MASPSLEGRGGSCKDEKGVFLFGFHEGYGLMSNTGAEIRAVHDGLLLCISKELVKIIVESNSLLVVNSLSEWSNSSWKWRYWQSRILRLMSKGQVLFHHILGEGNRPADGLDRLGSNS